MTLGELLTQCKNVRRGRRVRVFVGCMTVYNGNLIAMNTSEWVKLSPYFNHKVFNNRMIEDTFVITL